MGRNLPNFDKVDEMFRRIEDFFQIKISSKLRFLPNFKGTILIRPYQVFGNELLIQSKTEKTYALSSFHPNCPSVISQLNQMSNSNK